jgi:hypothetical protein
MSDTSEWTGNVASPSPVLTQADLDAAVQKALEDKGIGKGLPEGGVLGMCTATPTLGILSAWWHAHASQIIYPMNCSRIPLMPIDKCGGKIAEMRNGIVQQCLDIEDGKADTHDRKIKIHSIFWLDDDVIPNRFVVQALLSHNRPIAAGCYFTKTPINSEPLIFPGGSSGTTKFQPGKCFESWGWAQGLSLVQLDVYRHMLKEMGDDMGKDEFGFPAWYKTPGIEVNENGSLTIGGTEDFPFFRRANQLGYRCMVDCRPQAFGWHYDIHGKTGYPLEQWKMFQGGRPIIWPGAEEEPDNVWK